MKYRIIIIAILFCLIVCFSKITYSLFQTESFFLLENMEIAEFIFETKRTDHIELDFADLKPGDIKEFNFQVSNTKDKNITNVTTEYQITIKTFHFMPLIIELYKDEQVVMTCDEDYSLYLRNTDNALVCDSKIWQLEHNTSETEDFKIKVSFPKECNGYEYIELVDYIDLDISSWQKIE